MQNKRQRKEVLQSTTVAMNNPNSEPNSAPDQNYIMERFSQLEQKLLDSNAQNVQLQQQILQQKHEYEEKINNQTSSHNSASRCDNYPAFVPPPVGYGSTPHVSNAPSRHIADNTNNINQFAALSASSMFFQYKNVQDSTIAECDVFSARRENILLRNVLSNMTNISR
jgi:hypothetical protein